MEEREACLSNLRVNIEPRWFEDYELVHVSDGLAVDITGGLSGKEDTRSLQIEVKALPGGSRDDGDGPREEEVITLAVPQRCNLNLMGKAGYFHDVRVGGGKGRIEGDLQVVVSHGNISVQKARGERVELRTGRVASRSSLCWKG